MQPKMINVVGAGSLGSFSVLLLSKMSQVFGCAIRVLDFDNVEQHNTRNQLYRETDTGRPKVEALAEIIQITCGVDLIVENKKVDSSTDLRDIVIVLVDKMDVRRSIFESCRYNASVNYFIEARTGENQALVYAFDPKDSYWVGRYEAFLYDDSESQNQPCATPESVPTLWTVATVIARLVTSYKNQAVFTNEFYQAIIDLSDWPSLVSEAFL